MKEHFAKNAAMLLIGLIAAAVCHAEDYAQKHDFEVDGIYYRYSEDGQSVSVTYRCQSVNWRFANLFSYGTGYSGDVVVPEQVTWQDVTYPVKAVDQYAFVKCDGMTSLQLPSTIESIGPSAFANNWGLKELTIPDAVTSIGDGAFSGCKNLKEIVIPDGVQTIGTSMFASCETLVSVTMPSGTTSIGDKAFDHCCLLETVGFSGQPVETGRLAIPDGVTYIGDNAFAYNRKLKSVVIPESVRRIGSSAFSPSTITRADILCNLAEIEYSGGYLNFLNIGKDIFSWNNYSNERELTLYLPDYYSALSLCLNNSLNSDGGYGYTNGIHLYASGSLITDFPIPENFLDIPDNSFDGIVDMRSVTLPSNLQVIGSCAFLNCKALETVNATNADALTTIKDQAFRGCSNLREFYIGKNIKTIGDAAFMDCDNLTKVDIGDLANWCGVDFQGGFTYTSKVTSNPLCYAAGIYLNGKELNQLSIPTGVQTIKKYAFTGAHHFDKLTIPNTVTTIEESAFAYCADLETVVFRKGTSLSTLGDAVFQGCTGLKNITLPTTITSFGNSMFRGCRALEAMTLPDVFTTIPTSTFYDCTSLASIAFSDQLTTIKGYAFYNCKALPRIDIPSTVNFIGTDAFNKCSGLTGVYITDLAAWCRIDMPGQDKGGGWAVRYNDNNPLLFAHNLYLNNELVTDLVIPEGVDAVAAWAFAGATCLKSVTIPEGCKKLGGAAFYNCPNLEAIHIPASMEAFETTIGYNYTDLFPFDSGLNADVKLYIEDLEAWTSTLGARFRMRDGYGPEYVYLYVKGELVEHLVIPETVTKMGAPFNSFAFTSVTLPAGLSSMPGDAFKYCTRLKYIYSRPRFAPTGTTGFNTGRDREKSSLQAIYVPKGRAGNYKTSWSNSADLIFEAPEDLNLTGSISATALTEELDAHNNIYDDVVPYLDLTEATLDETVTEEVLQDIADNGTIVFLPEDTEGIEGTNIVAGGRTQKLIMLDSTNFAAPYDFIADELVYKRHFAAGNLAGKRLNHRNFASDDAKTTTMCLPFSLNELPRGMKAYTLTGQDEWGNVIFDEVGAVEANMPYIVTTATNIDQLQGKNVLVKATPAEMPYAFCDAFKFRGTLSDISHDDAAYEDAYVLGADWKWLSVYDADEDVYVPAGHAYLISLDATAGEEIATGVGGVNQETTDDATYDLSGRRVEKVQQKGIYIVGGKKMSVK